MPRPLRHRLSPSTVRMVLPYALLLGAAAFVLEWLDFRHAMRTSGTTVYITSVAIVFIALGIWLGARLFQKQPQTPAFQRNDRAIAALGLSAREIEVLGLMAAGQANKEIARSLGISPNTVKTHAASVLAKLEAPRRTQAIARARELQILP